MIKCSISSYQYICYWVGRFSHRLDTLRVECLHAAIRRLLQSKSGTWAPSLEQLSADFMTLVARRIQRPSDQQSDDEGEEADDESPEKHYANVGGGPQRAFVHQYLQGMSLDSEGTGEGTLSGEFTAMWVKYREIKQENGPRWHALVRLGKAGHKTVAAGGKAFGPKIQLQRHIPECLPKWNLVPPNGSYSLTPFLSIGTRVNMREKINNINAEEKVIRRNEQAAAQKGLSHIQQWTDKELTNPSFKALSIKESLVSSGFNPTPAGRCLSITVVQGKPPLQKMVLAFF